MPVHPSPNPPLRVEGPAPAFAKAPARGPAGPRTFRALAFLLALTLPGPSAMRAEDPPDTPADPPAVAPPAIDEPTEHVPPTRAAAAEQSYRTVKSASLLEAEKAVAQVVRKAFPDELSTYFPVGREFKGVTVPSYEEDELKSVMNASVVKRIDERLLELTDLVITLHSSPDQDEAGGNGDGKEADKSGSSPTEIRMDEAEYDLLEGRLTSRTPARVSQTEFEMTGNQMIFDTQTQVTRMVGDVVTVIKDAGKITPDFGPLSK